MTNATNQEIANWMLEELQARGILYQSEAVKGIKALFGSGFLYKNANGKLVVSPATLREFKKLKPSAVVWRSGRRCWQ